MRCGSAARRSASRSISSEDQYEMMERSRSWPRKPVGQPRRRHVVLSARRQLDKAGETAMDVCAYAAHGGAAGRHIIKVKPPTNVLWQPEAKAAYERPTSTSRRWPHHQASCRRLRRPAHRRVSGGEAKDLSRSPRSAACATAAPTARSSAATPSSARASRRSTCSTRSSASIGARCETARSCRVCCWVTFLG